MTEAFRPDSPDGSQFSRRRLARALGTAALATSVPLIGTRRAAAAAPGGGRADPHRPGRDRRRGSTSRSRTTSASSICFPFDHPKRSEVHNNWAIVKPTIGDLTNEQQALCQEIFKNLCSEEGLRAVQKQMDDDYGGFENYHVAVFGEPGTDKPFEWVLTGRHNTLRADGNSVEGAAFGGPIFYGHAADGSGNEDAKHTGNVWWYQGQQANEIFATLDDKQKATALVDKAEADDARVDPPQGRAARRHRPGRRPTSTASRSRWSRSS